MTVSLHPALSSTIKLYVFAARSDLLPIVDPSDQRKDTGSIAFSTVTITDPLLSPLHVTGNTSTTAVSTQSPEGTATRPSTLHPLASITVTLYAPEIKLLAVAVRSPVDHSYSYGVVPPDNTKTVAVPSPASGLLSAVLEVDITNSV